MDHVQLGCQPRMRAAAEQSSRARRGSRWKQAEWRTGTDGANRAAITRLGSVAAMSAAHSSTR
jgi:hypothetical protein